MKTYYKIVRVIQGRFYSITDVGYMAMLSSFKVGTWITAPVGGFFAFKTKQAAKNYLNTHHLGSFLGWKIMPCRLRDLITVSAVFNGSFGYTRQYKGYSSQRKQIRKFWSAPAVPGFVFPNMGPPISIFPEGTVCAREMRLLPSGTV